MDLVDHALLANEGLARPVPRNTLLSEGGYNPLAVQNYDLGALLEARPCFERVNFGQDSSLAAVEGSGRGRG